MEAETHIQFSGGGVASGDGVCSWWGGRVCVNVLFAFLGEIDELGAQPVVHEIFALCSER